MNRCLNDFFAYCAGEPTTKIDERSIQLIDPGGNLYYQTITLSSCINNPNTCPYHQTPNQRYLVQHNSAVGYEPDHKGL